MDFDPLSLFTPRQEPVDNDPESSLSLENTQNITSFQHDLPTTDFRPEIIDDSTDLHPFHILDLPLLQLSPPELVIIVFLKLLAPAEVQNFQTQELDIDVKLLDIVPEQIFDEKGIKQTEISQCIPWITQYCPRFNTEKRLACIPILTPLFKRSNEAQYNAWLTRIISNPGFEETTLHLASLRIAETCGRAAQPDIVRKIVIDGLQESCGVELILLREPSITNDNLGLKTWGSALILAERLMKSHQRLLRSPVLELGAGTGLVGIVSAALGHQTIMTDLPAILPNLRQNVQLNDIDAEVDELDWREPLKFVMKHGDMRYNTLVFADLVYLPQHPYWVSNMAKMFLEKTPESRLLLQIPLRPKFKAERDLLWSLLDPDFEVLCEEILNGRDDFGESQYVFKELKWREVEN